MKTRYFSCIFLLLTLAASAAASAAEAGANDCVYTLFVKTGDVEKAGTDSKISVTLGDSCGKKVHVANLEKWGLMDQNHDYYERGNLDVFSGRAQCLSAPICMLNLTSDGTGIQPGWFVEHVEVNLAAPRGSCSQTIFFIDEWLAVDRPHRPYKMSVVLERCKERSPFIVGNNGLGSTSQ